MLQIRAFEDAPQFYELYVTVPSLAMVWAPVLVIPIGTKGDGRPLRGGALK